MIVARKITLGAIWGLALLGGSARGQAPAVHFVADLLPSAVDGDTNPSVGTVQKDWLLFFGRPGTSWMPYTSDGTFSGTSRLPNSIPIALPPLAARVGDRVIFGAATSAFSGDVWSTDGTAAGTRRILAGYTLAAVPDRWHGGPWIVFGASNGSRTYLFWTDGSWCNLVSGAGTAPSHLTALAWQSGTQTRHLTFFSSLSPYLSSIGREPYVFELGPSGAATLQLVHDLWPSFGSGFVAPNDSTGFATWVEPTSRDLYVATIGNDGVTGSEVRRLRRPFSTSVFTLEPSAEVAPGPGGAAPRDLVARGGDVFFTATNAALGQELWRMSLANGQLASLDLEPGPLGSAPQDLVAMPSSAGPLPDLWFSAEVSGPGRELWRHDGTSAAMLVDANPGEGSSRPKVLGHADGRVFFAAENPTSGRELWRTDGSPGGTSMAFDAVPGLGSSDPKVCGVLTVGATESLLYAADSPFGRELHRADASTVTPVLVRNLTNSILSSSPRAVAGAGAGGVTARWSDGRALILASSPPSTSPSWSLWAADGQSGIATQLLGPGFLPLPETPQAIAFGDGTALLLVNYGSLSSANPSLYVTDGTPAGTSLARTLPVPGIQKPRVFGLMEFGNRVYFGIPASSAESGLAQMIWSTDRTGASLQADVMPAQGLRRMADWTVVGDRIFLTGERVDGSTGRELWVWQPPAAPTLVADIRPGAAGSSPASLVAFRNRCFFTADDGVHGRELWASNGLASGTFLVRDANPGPGSGAAGPLVDVGTLVYAGNDGVHGSEPWRSSGVQTGTAMIADLRPGPLGSSIGSITPVHVGVVACAADDGVHGRELWRIDTTTGATLFDLRPGAFGSSPTGLVWSTRHLFFSADDGVHGREPWYASWIDFQSVAMVADLAPGFESSTSSLPAIPAGRHVMFAADEKVTGRGNELWAVDMSGASSPIGDSCVRPFQTLRLRSTAPRLGQGLTYWVFEPGVGAPATTLMSLLPAAPGPVTLPNVSCPVWVDPASAVVVDSFVTTGNFVRTVTVPAALALLGTVARMQVLLDYPPNLATNGLELVVGN
ncbi:MAG: hypothetical protein IPK26_20700 [Planctomycetes bacterium]|nr:hypothetical protein [Planctomycetota bacterium]